MSHKYFISPIIFKKKNKINSLKNLSSIHTRNVPHTVHQWIYNFLFNKFGALLIQPLVGQYKKNEYHDQLIINANKIAAKIFKSKKVMCIPFFRILDMLGLERLHYMQLLEKTMVVLIFGLVETTQGIKSFIVICNLKIFAKKIKSN